MKYLLMCCLLLCSGEMLAQKIDHPWVLSTNLVSMIEPDGGPSINLEYKFNRRWSVSMEAEMVLYNWASNLEDYNTNTAGEFVRGGIRLRPEARIYLTHSRRLFFSGMFMYKRVELDELFYVDNYSYQSTVNLRGIKESVGFTPKIGFQTFIRGKVLFEISGGLGAAYRIFRYKDRIPQNVIIPAFKDDEAASQFRREEWEADFPLSIRFGYRF